MTEINHPFAYKDVYKRQVQGSGVVRPVTEKTEIKSSITELIDSVYVREGDQVNKGDVLPVSYTHLMYEYLWWMLHLQ